VLVSQYGASEALRRLSLPNLDSYAIRVLRRFISLEPKGFGRDEDYHYRDGFYPRQFARMPGNSVYVGYSEDTYYVLTETAVSCLHGQCLDKDKIRVARWPFSDRGAQTVAWVDMYMIDAEVTGAKLRDAEAFIKFMMRVNTYKQLLFPAPDAPPRYLLPARDDLYSGGHLSKGPLYPQLRMLIDSATPVTQEGLNGRLHDVAAQLEKVLPPSH
jgi:hypothetical protein